MMATEIVEAASYAKTGEESLNEDVFVVDDGVVAVFDGETNKGAAAVRRLVGERHKHWRALCSICLG